ncbi:MAG: orotate phosphoribosyltransferase, partial [Alphaproteobacteria bacterium]|nr:orotate phosphoribosyltransferase [Alphaproteobacteria bacterium]
DAVQFWGDHPFMLTSGWASPVYVDCRRLISYPRIRRALTDFAVATIVRDVGFERIDLVAGGETAGVPFAAWIADRLMLPMQFVRKRAKGFGPAAQIEGIVSEGARTLLVEDLTTDGESKLAFCRGLRRAGARVDHAFVVFQYGIFPGVAERFAAIGLTLHTLATWWDVLREAERSGAFPAARLAELRAFLDDPGRWSSAHGGIAALPEAA